MEGYRSRMNWSSISLYTSGIRPASPFAPRNPFAAGDDISTLQPDLTLSVCMYVMYVCNVCMYVFMYEKRIRKGKKKRNYLLKHFHIHTYILYIHTFIIYIHVHSTYIYTHINHVY